VNPSAVEPVPSDSQVKEKPSVSADTQPSQSNGPLTYEVLRGPWKPDEAPQGLGLELLIPESATQEQIIRLLRDLAAGKDPVFINMWTNRQVWANAKKNIYDDAYDQHLICVYVKNMTGRGLFAGFNEIRWMQEKGRFSHLSGKTTPMQ
jgi:hypothetical protein